MPAARWRTILEQVRVNDLTVEARAVQARAILLHRLGDRGTAVRPMITSTVIGPLGPAATSQPALC